MSIGKKISKIAYFLAFLVVVLAIAIQLHEGGQHELESLFVTKAYAAENDVATWTASGTCEWGIDPDGCLWVRPTNGVSGTLSDWAFDSPWHNSRASVKTVIVKPGVSAVTCTHMFSGFSNCTTMNLSGLNTSNVVNMSYMFSSCSSLTSIDFSGWDTRNVTNMTQIFYGCSSLTSLDVSGFDTSSVTIMYEMFHGCSSLTSLNLSGFNTSNVTDMQNMFCYCNSLASLNLSGFNTSKVTNMQEMFAYCNSLTSLDVSSFNTSNVTNMNSMFFGCSSLTSLDVRGFNTSNVTNMGRMFQGCSTIANLDLSGFDTSSCTNMLWMFANCSALETLNVSSFNTSNVTSMSAMFCGCSSLTALDVSNFNTQNVTAMVSGANDGMFKNCSSLKNLDLSNFDTSKVSNMWYLFSGCRSLETLNLSGWDTSNVTNMSQMFGYCQKLTTINLSSFNTEKVTDMSHMFQSCYELTDLMVDNFNTSNVNTFNYIFGFCYKLDNPPVGGWDVSNATNFYGFFAYCNSLTEVDLTQWDTGSANNMEYMFRSCSSLTSLDLSGFNTSNVINMGSMFKGCSKLTSIDVNEFDTSSVTTMSYMFDGCSSMTSIDISGWDTKSSVTSMQSLFNNCRSLASVTIGEDFAFNGQNITTTNSKALLPTPTGSAYTGKWVLQGDELGTSAMTPTEMRDAGTVTSGTWVWQEVPTKYTVHFIYQDSGNNTSDVKYRYDEIATLNPSVPPVFNMRIASWTTNADGTGTEYADSIPANTYEIGDEVTLYGQWEQIGNVTKVSDGVYEITLPANARMLIDNVPAGASYRIYEEQKEDGWSLASQRNTSGEIVPLTTSTAIFKNKYDPASVSVSLYATKIMDNAPADPSMSFEFSLTYVGNVDDNDWTPGTLIETASVSSGGAVLFEPLAFTNPGTYNFEITENWESYSGPLDASIITWDTHVESIQVVVTEEDNTLSARVVYDADGPGFVNRTNPGNLTLTKNTTGLTGANKDDVFTFRIRLIDPSGGPMSNSYIQYGPNPQEETSEP